MRPGDKWGTVRIEYLQLFPIIPTIRLRQSLYKLFFGWRDVRIAKIYFNDPMGLPDGLLPLNDAGKQGLPRYRFCAFAQNGEVFLIGKNLVAVFACNLTHNPQHFKCCQRTQYSRQ